MKVDRSKEKDDLVQKPSRGQQVKRFTERPKESAGEATRFSQRKKTSYARDTTRPSRPKR